MNNENIIRQNNHEYDSEEENNVTKNLQTKKSIINENDSISESSNTTSSNTSTNSFCSQNTNKKKETVSIRHHKIVNDHSTTDTKQNTIMEKKEIYIGNNGETNKYDEMRKEDYVAYCKHKGLMDAEKDLTEEVKRVTKKYGWKQFKILDNEDWRSESNFAGVIMRKLGILVGSVPNTVRTRKWESIKKDVIASMQAVKSSATQAMKRVFIGK